ncbi:bll4173 [Bradyrhizobium diazoefficiens USDA 110]|uniref:Bll4173 protein n=2 Tax=Bradyrhizobium diazoefficiens TaxID=1355477 RepID=Q89MM0_BRADU|nr:hypothetical protein CO678_14715 [Bradyrhizobium diazoefficiens]QBP22938.1 hypothetical protein Bdiaspc4_21620 [Bradyrhizobium diazoefficiens]BAC49438.1 bll4173 [Bradyrhizobium diazoefficiens USDA 110]
MRSKCTLARCPGALRSIKGGVEPVGARARQRGMNRTEPSAEEQIEAFITSAAKQPLLDAAFELWRWRYRLDSIEGRPTAEEVRINRTLSPQQMAEKYRYDRDHAHEGSMFGYVKRAHPRADDNAIRQAIITAVKFEGAAEAHFKWDGDFWDCVVRAVAQAAAEYPDFLETTYRDARNNLAYYMK